MVRVWEGTEDDGEGRDGAKDGRGGASGAWDCGAVCVVGGAGSGSGRRLTRGSGKKMDEVLVLLLLFLGVETKYRCTCIM
jgi:hypothetical protein